MICYKFRFLIINIIIKRFIFIFFFLLFISMSISNDTIFITRWWTYGERERMMNCDDCCRCCWSPFITNKISSNDWRTCGRTSNRTTTATQRQRKPIVVILCFSLFHHTLQRREREIRSNHLLGPIFGISFIQFQKKKKS